MEVELTQSSVSSVYNFLPLYIFSVLANFSEKISKLLNPTNLKKIGNVGEGTDLNQLMDGRKACSVNPAMLSNTGESTGQEAMEVKVTVQFPHSNLK